MYSFLGKYCSHSKYVLMMDIIKFKFINRFYYPFGKPENQQQWDIFVKTITDFFLSLPNSQASKHHFGQISKVINLFSILIFV